MTCDDCAILRQENNELRRRLHQATHEEPIDIADWLNTTEHHDIGPVRINIYPAAGQLSEHDLVRALAASVLANKSLHPMVLEMAAVDEHVTNELRARLTDPDTTGT